MRPMMISKVNTAAQIALAAVLLAELGLPLDTGLLLPALIYLVAALQESKLRIGQRPGCGLGVGYRKDRVLGLSEYMFKSGFTVVLKEI